MTHRSTPVKKRRPAARRRRIAALAAAALTAAGAGCANVPAFEQANVSAPNMLITESPVYAMSGISTAIAEPGAIDAASTANTGCSTCR